LVGRPEEKKPLGRSRCRWENNIKMTVQEVGWEGVDWIVLAQDSESRWASVNAAMDHRVP